MAGRLLCSSRAGEPPFYLNGLTTLTPDYAYAVPYQPLPLAGMPLFVAEDEIVQIHNDQFHSHTS